MAIKLNTSGDARDFDHIWTYIRNLVSVEWQAVRRECGDQPPGFYNLSLELVWDIEPTNGVQEEPSNPVSEDLTRCR
jgi:hypothetical protein